MNKKNGAISWGLIPKVVLYLWTGFSIFSFLWILISSLKTNRDFFANIWSVLGTTHIENYLNVWVNYDLGKYFLNSLFVVLISVVGIVVISAPAAYVLSRIKFKYRDKLEKLFIFGMGVPYQLLLVPLFFILFKLKLIDSLWGLILVYMALSLPFTIFLMIGFFKSLPHELEEAAYIDGCGPMMTFIKVMLPLGQPAIITSSIFNFVFLWNEFLLALTFLQTQSKFTLSLGIYALQGSMQYTGDWTGLFAGFIMVVIPTFTLYLLLSRRIIEGLTLGAVKQ